ncbi:MAG: DUF362 domain-containing protein [Candidatus Bathyarchaeia archaeon]
MSIVSLVKAKGYDVKSISASIMESLDLINYSFEGKKIRNVVIKPNLCYYWDCSTGQTTDPKFVEALVNVLREKVGKAVDITLVESDASAMKCKYAFKFLGYEKLSKTIGVKLVNLTEEKSESTHISCNGKSYDFSVPAIIKNADLTINLPKIKYTMKGIELTCALKNIFGCNPYPLKYKLHADLGNVIVALNKAMPFDLCIIDSIIASGSRPKKMGLIMASQDPVAIDVAAANIAGVNPKKINYLKIAEQEGVGGMRFVEKGVSLNQFREVYPKKTFTKKFMGAAYPWVIRLGLGKRLGLTS